MVILTPNLLLTLSKETKQNLKKNCSAIDEAIERYRSVGPFEDAWSLLAPESEVERIESEMERDHVDISDVIEDNDIIITSGNTEPSHPPVLLIVTPSLVSGSEMRKMYQTMNEMQATEFYFVRKWCQERIKDETCKPFFHFVTGGAGTGKSHLIKCIYNEATKILQHLPMLNEESNISKPTVLLTAPTGTAAYNIKGNTLHHSLKLPIRFTFPYKGLGNELDKLRVVLQNLQILVIDGISMVNKKMLAYINYRLQQSKGNKHPFGNVSILAVGNFYQLPPLFKNKPLCIYEDEIFDFWADNFELIELTEIMRQQDDLVFAQMLSRIRKKQKHESLSVTDKKLLASVCENDDVPNDALHIFVKNIDVDEYNAKRLHELFRNTVLIKAEDYTSKGQRISAPSTDKKQDKNCLPNEIEIAIGARVVLIRNIDVEDGLVNGSFGTIRGIIENERQTWYH